MRRESMMYIRCLDCEHCNEIKKKCYPKSLDCNSEYDLSDEEIYEYNETKCDFYKKTVKNFKSPNKQHKDCLSCANSFSYDSPNGDILHCMLHNGKIVRKDECCDEWN